MNVRFRKFVSQFHRVAAVNCLHVVPIEHKCRLRLRCVSTSLSILDGSDWFGNRCLSLNLSIIKHILAYLVIDLSSCDWRLFAINGSIFE